jgi:hypothetical protein
MDTFAYDAADAQAPRRPCRSKRLPPLARIGYKPADRSIRAGPGPGPFQSQSRGLLLAGRQSRHSPAPSARTPLGRTQNSASRRLRASRQAETNGSRGQGRHGSQHKPRISRMLMNGRYATITRPGKIAANIPGDAPRCSIQTRHPLVGCLRGRSCLRPRRSPSSGAAATAKSPIRQTTPTIGRISRQGIAELSPSVAEHPAARCLVFHGEGDAFVDRYGASIRGVLWPDGVDGARRECVTDVDDPRAGRDVEYLARGGALPYVCAGRGG